MTEKDEERLDRFGADHPDITITRPAEPGGFWSAYQGGIILCLGRSAGELLDKLAYIGWE